MPLAMQTRSKMCGPSRRVLGPVPVLGQVGEGHGVVGEHDVDLVGEDLHDVAQERRAFHLSGAVVELHVGEFRDPIDG
jgi:hypothetical protein